jgi:hypothetical protein
MTNNIAAQAEQWWAEHGGVHDSPQWRAFLADFAQLLPAKLYEQEQPHDNKERFGMSKAGGCTRAAVLKLQKADAVPFSGSTRVTFWHGHMAEVMAIATLRALGYGVAPTDQNGEQFPVSIDPFMHSYTDGYISLDRRMLLSVKSTGYKMSGFDRKSSSWRRFGFSQFPADGVKKTNPGYWAQAQAEIHSEVLRGSDVRSSLFFLVAKDIIKKMEGDPMMQRNGSMSFYAEVIEYDEAFCASQLLPTWAEAWEAHNAGALPEAKVISVDGEYVTLDPRDSKGNKARVGTFDHCSYCDLFDACNASILGAQLRDSLEVA